MPELPEVETIAKALRQGGRDGPTVVGRRILSGQVLWERTLASPSPADFKRRIAGQVIEEVGRRGKFLVLRLTHDVLLVHLRMSGDLLVKPTSKEPESHDRLMLDLEGDIRLSFNDARKFGRIWLTSAPERVLADLGPEPLDPAFTPEELHRRLKTRRRQLKPLLLDQTFLAGLGNIYTDEALNIAKLHPLTIASRLEGRQAERLWQGIRQVLRDGIRRQGASIDWVYRGGEFQNHFRVYQRAGQPCPQCGTPIQRIVVG